VSASIEEPWLLATGSQDDAPLICRLRTRPPTDEERAHYPQLVMIRWAFEPEGADDNHGDDALPEEDELESMAALEEALHASMSAQGWGTIVAVVTTGGVREWRTYTQDLDRFQEGLNDALIGQPRYPLSFETFDDPDWRAYDEIAASMVPRGQA
jgi:hypothetical protein